QPPGRHHAVVAHREVSRHSRLPGQGDPVFQPGAPRDPGHGDDEAVLAYLHVVPYLDQVVDLGAPADPGGPADAPVDGGVSPDLHVVLDHYGPDVRHFPVLAAHRDVPEPVAADDRPRVDDHPLADLDPVEHGDAGMKVASLPDDAVPPDDDAGTEDRAEIGRASC